MIMVEYVWLWKKREKTKAVRTNMMKDISLASDREEVTSHSKYVWEASLEAYIPQSFSNTMIPFKVIEIINVCVCTITWARFTFLCDPNAHTIKELLYKKVHEKTFFCLKAKWLLVSSAIVWWSIKTFWAEGKMGELCCSH